MTADTGRHQLLIDTLGLQSHPEGGHFGEVFKAGRRVDPVSSEESGSDGPSASRSALTTIYFLLNHPEFSHWHSVRWDEVWHFYEGAPLEHWTIDPDTLAFRRRVLGSLGAGQSPVLIVPGGSWQAARPISGFTLSGCTVAPGFEFEDFALLRDDHVARQVIEREFPSLAYLL